MVLISRLLLNLGKNKIYIIALNISHIATLVF